MQAVQSIIKNRNIKGKDLKKTIIVGIAGFFGAVSRYIFYQTFGNFTLIDSNYTTIIVNILGALILSFSISMNLSLFTKFEKYQNEILSGFVGSFSTFSTMVFDMSKIRNGGSSLTAVLYITLSIAGGLLMMTLGKQLGTWVNKKVRSGPIIYISEAQKSMEGE